MLGLKFAKSELGAALPRESRKVKEVFRTQGWRETLKELQRIVESYSFNLEQTLWTGYSDRAVDEKGRKHHVILDHLRKRRPRSMHELAGNTAAIGEQVAFELGIPVCVTDIDASCIDAAYQRTRRKDALLSLGVLDLLFPVPPYGAGNCRPGSVQRLEAGTTLATALIHHMVARSRVSMATFVQIVADYAQEHAVIEWVDPSDKFLLQWASKGVAIPADYKLANFLAQCAEHFPWRMELPAYHPTRRLFEFTRNRLPPSAYVGWKLNRTLSRWKRSMRKRLGAFR